jgi:hypothetical protein
MPRKIFVITIIIKVVELAFIHFFPGQFLDLQWSGRRGWSGGFKAGKKGWFSVLRRDNVLCFLSSFSSFHPTLRASHEDMGTNLILEATNKAFPENSIRHALRAESQALKSNYKVFHCARLFQLGQTA